MRYLFKKTIPIIIVLLIAGLVFLGYSYATKNLKLFISKLSEEKFNSKLSIGSIAFSFPLCMELKDVKFNDSIYIPEARFYPHPTSFLFKDTVVISMIELIDPVVRIKKGENLQVVIPDFLKQKDNAAHTLDSGKPNIFFSKARIENGSFIYNEAQEDMLELVKIKGLVKCPRFYFSKNQDINFVLTGFLKNKDTEFLSPLKIAGKRGADNVIKARLQGNDIKLSVLDAVHLEYLGALIDKGRVDIESDIQIANSNLAADCILKGKDVIIKTGGSGKKINAPIIVSFMLFFNFNDNVLKIKNIQGNILSFLSKKE